MISEITRPDCFYPGSHEFITWAQQNNISATKLAHLTGLTYQHSWSLLRGKRIRFHTLARLLIVFGEEGPALRIAQAMRASEKKSS